MPSLRSLSSFFLKSEKSEVKSQHKSQHKSNTITKDSNDSDSVYHSTNSNSNSSNALLCELYKRVGGGAGYWSPVSDGTSCNNNNAYNEGCSELFSVSFGDPNEETNASTNGKGKGTKGGKAKPKGKNNNNSDSMILRCTKPESPAGPESPENNVTPFELSFDCDEIMNLTRFIDEDNDFDMLADDTQITDKKDDARLLKFEISRVVKSNQTVDEYLLVFEKGRDALRCVKNIFGRILYNQDNLELLCDVENVFNMSKDVLLINDDPEEDRGGGGNESDGSDGDSDGDDGNDSPWNSGYLNLQIIQRKKNMDGILTLSTTDNKLVFLGSISPAMLFKYEFVYRFICI